MAVRTKLVPIGHSRGIRIPRALIAQAELGDDLELEAKPGQLIVRPAPKPLRAGWAEDAAAMHAAGEDRLLDPPTATQFDRDDWTW